MTEAMVDTHSLEEPSYDKVLYQSVFRNEYCSLFQGASIGAVFLPVSLFAPSPLEYSDVLSTPCTSWTTGKNGLFAKIDSYMLMP